MTVIYNIMCVCVPESGPVTGTIQVAVLGFLTKEMFIIKLLNTINAWLFN